MTVLYKKYTPIAVLIVLLCAIGGVAWFGIRPLEKSLAGKMRSTQEFYASRENRERQVKRLPELEGQYATIVANERTLDILITEDRVVDFVKTLETLSGDMGVELSIVSKEDGKIIERKKPAPPLSPSQSQKTAEGDATAQNNAKQKTADIADDTSFPRYLRVSVQVSGRYVDIIAFLRKMETLPLGLDVIGAEVKKADESSTSRSAVSGPGENPFAILGGNKVVPAARPQAVKGMVEAAFDVLLYVNKKTDL